MERRRLGKTDLEVAVLGLGGSEIGYQRIGERRAGELLQKALDAGLNVIDTAECYYESEEWIGKTVGHRRKEYFLFTKCGHPGGPGLEDWRPGSLIQSIERSLRRLRTDYVDLIQLHSCSEAILSKGEVVEALRRARERGYARYIGYSGDSLAARYAVECGAFDTLQTSINIADQEVLELTLPIARERQMGVIAKRPIANAAWKTRNKPGNPYYLIYWERLKKLNFDFLNQDLQSAVSTALRFTLSRGGVHTAIVGTTKPGRWQQNASYLEEGPLEVDATKKIRQIWQEVAKPDWIGQI